jgi:hypothetical protein
VRRTRVEVVLAGTQCLLQLAGIRALDGAGCACAKGLGESPLVLLVDGSVSTRQRTERMKAIALTLTLGLLTAGSSACSSPQQPASSVSDQRAADQLQIPAALNVPAGNKLVGKFEGHGQQIYACANSSWTLLEPAAILSDNGNPVAFHTKGPVWVSTVDGSEVHAAPVPNATVSHSDAIPELLLKSTQDQGTGQFGSTTYVQRLQTQGGLAPKGQCTNAARVSVPYSALYVFYTAG